MVFILTTAPPGPPPATSESISILILLILLAVIAGMVAILLVRLRTYRIRAKAPSEAPTADPWAESARRIDQGD